MWNTMLRSAVAGLTALVLMGATHADARTLDEIFSSEVIKVGIETDLPPLGSYNEQNEIVGFDVDFATKIAEMLGVKLEIVGLLGTDRIPFVVSGKIDFVMGALTRTPARAKVVDYTLPVHTESFAVLTTADKPFKHWKDLNSADVTLIQVRGTTPVEFIKNNLPDAKLILLDNNADAVRGVAQGRGDAIIDVLDFFSDHMGRHDVEWKVVETPIAVYYCGLGIAKGNYTLRDWLNIAIFELHNNGFIDEAWRKWFGMDMVFTVKPSPYF